MLVHYLPIALRGSYPLTLPEMEGALSAGAVSEKELGAALNLLELHRQVERVPVPACTVMKFKAAGHRKFPTWAYRLSDAYDPRVVRLLTDVGTRVRRAA